MHSLTRKTAPIFFFLTKFSRWKMQSMDAQPCPYGAGCLLEDFHHLSLHTHPEPCPNGPSCMILSIDPDHGLRYDHSGIVVKSLSSCFFFSFPVLFTFYVRCVSK